MSVQIIFDIKQPAGFSPASSDAAPVAPQEPISVPLTASASSDDHDAYLQALEAALGEARDRANAVLTEWKDKLAPYEKSQAKRPSESDDDGEEDEEEEQD